METDLLRDLQIMELPNKLQIWCRKLPNTDSISLRLMITVGATHQSLKDIGLAHFVEHLVFNFRQENNSKQIFDEVEQSGGYINATTALDSTVFAADIPSNKFERCLELIENCFLYPDFSIEAIKKERRIILNELLNEPTFWYKIYKEIFGNYALAYSGLGMLKTIKKIDKNKIESFFRKNYVLNKMVLICVGNLGAEEIRNKIELRWSKLPMNDEQKEHYIYPKLKKRFVKISMLEADKSITYGYRVCGYVGFDKDYYIMWLIRDYFQKLLFNFVRDQGMLYDIDIVYKPYNFGGLFYIYVRYIEKKRRALINKIKSEINNFKNNLIDENEFKKSRDFTINQFLSYIKDGKELANYYIHLAEGFKDDKDLEDPIAMLQSVRPLDIKEASKKYFIQDKGFLVVGVSVYEKVFAVGVAAIGLIMLPLIFISTFWNIFILYDNIKSFFSLRMSSFITIILVMVIFWLIIDRRKLLQTIKRLE